MKACDMIQTQGSLYQCDRSGKELNKVSNPAIGTSWEEARKQLFTEEEIRESEQRVKALGDAIKAKQGSGTKKPAR